MATLSAYAASSQHPKIHAVSENLMRKIEKNKIVELYPSLIVTRALHSSLLLSEIASPIGKIRIMNTFPFEKESLQLEENDYGDFSHSGAFLFKDTVPFCRFLWNARKSCFKHLKDIGIGLPHAEYFFLHTVFKY